MQQYFLTESAEADLIDIWNYTQETWGDSQADRYVKGLEYCCETLAENPKFGKNIREIHKNLQVYRHEYHYIFFIEKANHIAIIAFFHEKMNMIQRIQSRLS